MTDEKSASEARLQLRRACLAASEAMQSSGATSQQIATAANIRSESVRRLTADGDKSGWRPPSLAVCRAIDKYCSSRLGLNFQLEHLRECYDTARSIGAAGDSTGDDLDIQVGNAPALAIGFVERPSISKRLPETTRIGFQGGGARIFVGNGGMGKTQYAADTFLRARDAGVTVRVWVASTSRRAIESSYAEAGRMLGISSATLPDSAGAELLMRWFSSTSTAWIVVLDDVRDPGDVRGLWPAGKRGFTLATTRRRDLEYAHAERVIVDEFAPSESARYLSSRLSAGEGTHPHATRGQDELARALGNLPLALAQAASYIRYAGQTCDEYLILFEQRAAQLAHLFPAHARADEYEATVATTWSLAVELADSMEPKGLATPAIELASVLDSAGIPERVWTGTYGLSYLTERGRPVGGEPFSFRKSVSQQEARLALRNLHLFSVLAHDPSPANTKQSVRIHNLVQLATLDVYGNNLPTRLLDAAAESIIDMLRKTPMDPVSRRNAEALCRTAGQSCYTSKVWRLSIRMATGLLASGYRDSALAIAASTVDGLTAEFGDSDERTLEARWDLARLRSQVGDAEKAINNLRTISSSYKLLKGSGQLGGGRIDKGPARTPW